MEETKKFINFNSFKVELVENEDPRVWKYKVKKRSQPHSSRNSNEIRGRNEVKIKTFFLEICENIEIVKVYKNSTAISFEQIKNKPNIQISKVLNESPRMKGTKQIAWTNLSNNDLPKEFGFKTAKEYQEGPIQVNIKKETGSPGSTSVKKAEDELLILGPTYDEPDKKSSKGEQPSYIQTLEHNVELAEPNHPGTLLKITLAGKVNRQFTLSIGVTLNIPSLGPESNLFKLMKITKDPSAKDKKIEKELYFPIPKLLSAEEIEEIEVETYTSYIY